MPEDGLHRSSLRLHFKVDCFSKVSISVENIPRNLFAVIFLLLDVIMQDLICKQSVCFCKKPATEKCTDPQTVSCHKAKYGCRVGWAARL